MSVEQKLLQSAINADKPQGLENAALQRAKHHATPPAPTPAPEDRPAVTISLSEGHRRPAEPEPAAVEMTYAAAARTALAAAARERPANSDSLAPEEVVAASSARIKINMHVGEVVGEAKSSGQTVLEAGASLKANIHAKTVQAAAGNGTLVLEEGARLKLNVHAQENRRRRWRHGLGRRGRAAELERPRRPLEDRWRSGRSPRESR
ncbi:MAG: polymer-forming cytoskeletal protein [Myxococcales bacterium]